MLIELKEVCIDIEDKTVVDGIRFHADEGEFVYLIGKVGAGKSSLLKLLYGELPLKSGEARILDFDLARLKRKHLPLLRRHLGIIFQDFQLLRDRTVEKNLDFLLRATGWKKKAARRQRIGEVLELVGLPDKLGSFPHELSGGEQQRISIARALLNHPRVILADEPTGNLDQDTGNRIVEILKSVSEKGTAVVMVTHNLNLLQKYPGIVYRMEEGRMEEVSNEYNTPMELEGA